MSEFFGRLFDTTGFVARKDCGDWTDALVWLHVGSDLFIWLAYLSIPLVLLYFVRRRRDLPFSGLFVLFALFIVCCGFTHFVDALIFYHPVYRLSGALKLVTAVVSWATVLALVPAVPQVLGLMAAVNRRVAADPAVRRELAARPRAGWRGYAVAVLAAALALLVRRLFDPLLGDTYPFIFALLAVVYVAWEAGFGPAVLAVAVGFAGTAYWFVPPRGSLVVTDLHHQIGLGLFVFVGLGCAVLGEAQRHARHKAETALAVAHARQAELEAEAARREGVEAALRASEERRRLALDAAELGAWNIDPATDTLTTDARFRAIFGATDGRLDYEPAFAAIHPDDRDRVRAAVAAATRPGDPAPYAEEYRVVHPAGAVRWVFAKGRASFVGEGAGRRAASFDGTVADITDRKAADDGLREQARLAALRAEVSARFAAAAPVRVVLRECAELLVRHLDAAFARIWTLDEAGATLELQASAGLYTHLDGPHGRVPVGRFKIGRIAESRRPHLTNDVANDPDVSDPAWARREGMAAFAGYPLVADGRVVGVLAVFARRPLSDAVLADLAPLAAAVAQWLVHREAGAALAASEGRFRFLDALGQATRAAADPEAVMDTTTRRLGGHLRVTRCAYAEVEADGDRFAIRHDWTDGAASTVGEYSLDLFGSRAAADMRAGRTLVVRDVDRELAPADGADTFTAIGIKAIVCCPLVQGGRLAAMMAVHAAAPRDWTAAEVGLVEQVVERSWAHIDRARGGRRLRQSVERFRVLTEGIPQLVWTCRPDGRCDYLSRQWVEYTGVPEADQLGYAWLDVLHPADRDRAAACWREAVAGRAAYDLDYRIRRHDGAYRWFRTRGTALRDGSGESTQWFGTCTDIDDQKRQEETLERLVRERTAELHRSNVELEQFAYVASHDLQEPLRKIQAFGGRLKDRCRDHLPDPGPEYVDRMLASAGRMSRLIDDLLAYSRVTTHARPFARVDLNAVLADVLDDLDVRIERAGAAVEREPLPAIDADPSQLRQLLQNLVGNALKFARPGVRPVVRVGAEVSANGTPESGACRLIVADNGIGFDEKYLDRIFQVFQRLHGRDEYDGTGVGLAICKKIADRHGGSITATSRPGAGATFVVTLPARHPAPPGGPAPTPATG